MTKDLDLELVERSPAIPEPRGPAEDLDKLKDKNMALQAEVNRLKKETSVESQKARLLIPYANRVFIFCCIYTTIAFGILLLHGFTAIPFKLETSTLNFIAGSNIASVTGLFATIAGGIFSRK
ncbi:MAG: hypothetical protein GDA55_02515 [Cellvibrionales bacterium]|nr:hypothetical protein [Cellvibrionales bacterium]